VLALSSHACLLSSLFFYGDDVPGMVAIEIYVHKHFSCHFSPPASSEHFGIGISVFYLPSFFGSGSM
jgi:hypothetical protein